jgi:hypothetical protein
MLIGEVSRALDEIAAAIAKLRYVSAELQRAWKDELKRRREQAATGSPKPSQS